LLPEFHPHLSPSGFGPMEATVSSPKHHLKINPSYGLGQKVTHPGLSCKCLVQAVSSLGCKIGST